MPEGDPKAADEAQESLAGGGRFGDNQSGALAPEAPVEAEMLAGKEISPVGSDAAPGDLGADDLQQEIARLRSRDVLLRSRMAALTRQAAEFRERIREMLEGGR